MMKRDNCFDFLRFIFAFNVVLGHLTVIALYPELSAYKGVFNTYLSVVGFFVISGFLIAQSYDRSTIKSYFIKRAKRLLPAYIFVVVGCAIGLVFVSTLSTAEYYSSAEWWKYLGANLSFMNFLHPWLPGVFNNPFTNDNSVNPALWTLKIEVGFYLILPLLMIWIRKTSKPGFVLLILYILSIIYREGCGYWADFTGNQFPVFMARQLPGFLTYFSAGMAGYLYKEQFMRFKNYIILPAILIFCAEYFFDIEYLMPLAWGSIVLWCAFSFPFLNNFAKYGDISYGIYIYHGPILKILLSVGIFNTLGLPLASSIYLIGVLCTGFISWHLLENRFLKRKVTT